MMRKREEPVIFQRNIPNDRFRRVIVPDSDGIGRHLKILELSIELGFEHFCHMLIPRE